MIKTYRDELDGRTITTGELDASDWYGSAYDDESYCADCLILTCYHGAECDPFDVVVKLVADYRDALEAPGYMNAHRYIAMGHGIATTALGAVPNNDEVYRAMVIAGPSDVDAWHAALRICNELRRPESLCRCGHPHCPMCEAPVDLCDCETSVALDESETLPCGCETASTLREGNHGAQCADALFTVVGMLVIDFDEPRDYLD